MTGRGRLPFADPGLLRRAPRYPARPVACYGYGMTKSDPVARDQETEAEQRDRLAWEAEGIAEARADVAAGRLVDAARVRAWVDSLRTDNPLPVPYSGR